MGLSVWRGLSATCARADSEIRSVGCSVSTEFGKAPRIGAHRAPYKTIGFAPYGAEVHSQGRLSPLGKRTRNKNPAPSGRRFVVGGAAAFQGRQAPLAMNQNPVRGW